MPQQPMARRTALKVVTGSLAAAGGLMSRRAARADLPRVLPKGKLPADRRLEKLKTLNGDFTWKPFDTFESWQERADDVRRQLLVALDLWPMPVKTPLKPIIHGKVDRDEYTVEKVIVETHPGLYLTGSLYRPKGKAGKRPGVLCPHGHWQDGRFHDHGEAKVKLEVENQAEFSPIGGRHPLQARCVQLARMGCVVLLYDMLGYADSQIIPSSVIHGFGKQRPDMSQPDRWGLGSAQSELRLLSPMGLQTWNSIRALDFLSELPDVDPQNIGVTGASGGGTQTFILACVDPRPKAFFPAVMVSTGMQGGCTCENCSYLRVNTGNIEFAAMIAPKPLGMTGANDWTKEIESKGLPELTEHFARMGAPGKVEAKYFSFEHNYNHPSRLRMYAFFNKHLHLGFDEIVERDYQPLTKTEAGVWDAEHPLPASGPEAELKILRDFDADSRKQMTALVPANASSLAEYRRVVGGGWNVLIGRGVPVKHSVTDLSLGEDDQLGYIEHRSLLRHRQQGEEVPALLLLPYNWKRELVIWLTESGKSGLLQPDGEPIPEVAQLLAADFGVCGLDLLYQGEYLKDGESLADTKRLDSPREFLGYTAGYNHPLFSQRVHDILSMIAFCRDHESEPNVHLIGFGPAALWAAAAAAQAGSAVKKVAVGTNGYRFASITDIRDPMLLPGAVKYGDVPGLLSLCAPQSLWVSGEKSEDLQVASQVYSASGQSSNLQIFSGSNEAAPLAAVQWIIG